MNKNLVIVESPTKAKTIEKFLGKKYQVVSSYGHVRDLPKSEMGIDIENNFTPRYIIPRAKQKAVTLLKKTAAKSAEIILATDEDREGEAIAWHLITALGIKDKPYHRIVFHEITNRAITEALEHPRELNINMVNAQQARRILDRLVGYELSPFLWRKVVKGLSAGRVQSVAVRLVVEREREIQAFKTEEYWTLEGVFSKKDGQGEFPGRLNKMEGKTLDKFAITDDKKAQEIASEIKKYQQFVIDSVEKKTLLKYPFAPYTTSTLQQDANRRLGYSARQTMMIAQQLYEGIKLGSSGEEGLITYMRTDSVNLAQEFLKSTQAYIKEKYGTEYGLPKPRYFKKKSKLAQEAHEAIRPTDITRTPDDIKNHLTPQQHKLYALIWERTLACQMKEAQTEQTNIQIATDDKKFNFTSNGNVIVFDGWLKIYKNNTSEVILPPVKEGESLKLKDLQTLQHFTQPPARYSDAGLVKTLEKYGIGRPSTYAPTIATIIERNYVTREERRLKPTEIAFLVNDILVEHFPKIVDYQFTAKMEDDLDEIANGKNKWQKVIGDFYGPFKENLKAKEEVLDKKEITETATDEKCEKCGSPMVIKIGRFGKFLACTNFPECKNTKNLGGSDGGNQEINEKCPECGSPLVQRRGRFGPFIGCSNYPNCKYIKKQEKGTGVTCPECQKGELVLKRTRKGRFFYACNRYPDCKFSLWSRPINEKCPKCGSILMVAGKDKIKCSNKECDFTKQAEVQE